MNQGNGVNEALAQEWTTLQTQYEAYERSGLLIKLLAVAWVGLTLVVPVSVSLGAVWALVLVLWAQEAILKTWQARLGNRLLVIEAAVDDNAKRETLPFQLHSQWQAQRPSTAGLLMEYAKSALRPTVAFPYAVLLVVAIFI